MKDTIDSPHFHIVVTQTSLPLFTTILQSGIEVKSTTATSIGAFISQFRGFTADYLADTVQTIFLNGTAVDDLTLLLSESKPVLALSGAMPGLAGAIFRKNSFHAALRSDTKGTSLDNAPVTPNTVTLKLFNRIAKERGIELLDSGVDIKSNSVMSFLDKRPNLWQHIRTITSETMTLSKKSFEDHISQSDMVSVKITY